MSPTTTSPADLKSIQKARILDPKPRAPLSSPTSRSNSVAPLADKKMTEAEADLRIPDSASGLSTIDMETFYQIVDLDEDDETHKFSRGMAWAYFSQAETTFKEMDEALAIKDLGKLSSLGHFLKGSSAALGVAKVQASCELIQHYGQLHDLEYRELTSDVALGRIEILLSQVKGEYTDAEKWLKDWYNGAGATASRA